MTGARNATPVVGESRREQFRPSLRFRSPLIDRTCRFAASGSPMEFTHRLTQLASAAHAD
jgi:hypothetical protein